MERRQKIAILFNDSSMAADKQGSSSSGNYKKNKNKNNNNNKSNEDLENVADQLNRDQSKQHHQVELKLSDQFDETCEMINETKNANLGSVTEIVIDSDGNVGSKTRAGGLRWLILALSCFIMFGNFYAYDNPSALNRQLRAWMADKSDAEFEYHLNLLYTVYSAPNIVLPFVVGRALDRFGSRHFLILLSILMCAGQAIFSMGVSGRNWPWMLIGRFIFGLGGESLAVAQSRLVTEWFLGRELGLAIGLNLSVARIGTVFNNNASPRIAAHSVSRACWIGLVTCVFSLICTLACILIDSYVSKEVKVELVRNLPSECKDNLVTATSDEDKFVNTASNDDKFIYPTFYLLLFLNFLSYGAVLCFNTVASAYLQERYFQGNIFRSNWAMSIPDSTAIFMVPLMGFLVDRTGLKLGCIVLGQAALACGHLLLALGNKNPYGSLLILGVGYSTLLAIWSCVPYLVGSGRQATAYGYITASTNLSSTLLPIIVAAFVSSDQSYLQVGLFFASLGALGLIVCVQVGRLNKSANLGLNSARVPNHMTSSFLLVKSDPKGLMGSTRRPTISNKTISNNNNNSFNYTFQSFKRNRVGLSPIYNYEEV